MEVKITDKKENLFFKRTEVKADIMHPGVPTPKRSEARKLLSEILGVPSENIVIMQLKSQFGVKSVCTAHIYKSKENLQKNVPAHIKGREAGQKLKHEKAKK